MGENCCSGLIYKYSFYWQGEYHGQSYTSNAPLHDVLANHIRGVGEILEGRWIVVRESCDSHEHVAAIFNVSRSDKFTVTSLD
jgi:hypothetical protein